ncbi:MAG: restriction endonuclease subunit S [Dehalococcoidia bacterium]|nr:restriction endonuclease subunit S [Dehalococcoidia bacterium]
MTRIRRLGEITEVIIRGAAPRYVESGGVAVLNQKCIRNQRVSYEDARRTDAESRPIRADRWLRQFDILVNSTGVGTLGRVGQVITIPEPTTVDSHVTIVRPAPSEVHPHFLGFALRSMQGEIESLATGSTGQTELSRDHLRELTLALPPLPEQRAIAEVLGALDDKIEANERMNATLDEMARALFKSWFVDFDPVRAKAEGRQPSHMDAATAARFPASFEDSALGPIPAGWRVGEVGDIVQSARNSVQPSEVEPGTAYVGLDHIPRRSLALADWGDVGSVTSGKVRFRKGDILFGRLRPYFTKVVVAPLDGICSSDIVVCRPTQSSYLAAAATQLADTAFIDYCDAASTGTRMPRVSWEDMSRYPMALPADAILEEFNALVEPWLSLMCVNTHESRTLAELRDTLLPRLISGEVRVKAPVCILGRDC